MNTSRLDIPPTDIQRSPYRFYVLFLALLATVLNYVDRIVIGVLQEPMKRDLGLTDWQLGMLAGPAFALFYSFSGVPVARLAERLNRARLLAVMASFWSAMTALCGAAAGFFQLALFRMGVGAGEGGCIPITHSLIADYFHPRRRGLVMSVVSASTSIAGMITPLVGAHIAEQYGWRMAFISVGLPGFVVALLVLTTLREPRIASTDVAKTHAAQPKSTLWADFRWLFGTPAFLFLFLAAACIGTANAGVSSFKISFLVRSHGMDLKEAGAVYSMAATVGLISSFVGGWLSDRFADDRGRSYVLVPAIGSIGCFTAFALAFLLSDPFIVSGLIIAASFFYNLKNGPMFAAVQNIVPSRMRATAAAFFMIGATAIGGGVGPILTGGISDLIATSNFDGDFFATCPGGRAVKGAATAVDLACKNAAADGLQGAMLVTACVFAVAGVMLWLASRSIRMASES